MLLAIVQRIHGFSQHFVADLGFFSFGNRFVVQRTIIGQPVLPFARTFLAIAHLDVQRTVAAHHHPAVHIDDFLLRHAQIGRYLRHVVRMKIAIFVSVEVLLHPSQVEEQFFLRGGGAHLHEAPAAENVFLDRSLDPPHRIGRQAEATIGFELLDALHQANIAF